MSYKVTVTHIPNGNVDLATTPPAELRQKTEPAEVFVQTFPEAEFDLQTIVLALNKKKRTRKARGKEAQ